MRYSPTLLNPTSWLNSLKISELQRIAQATGIRTAGPKPALISRLGTELAQYEFPSSSSSSHNQPQKQQPPPSSKNKNLSILSIDMGIRNLAFAHLTVPNPTSTPGHSTTPTLNAWHRLAVSDLSPDSTITTTTNTSALDRATLPQNTGSEAADLTLKGSFSPPLYAEQAYALITTLLATYQPTHVLIERQRFRTGSGSAVQEWTLKVGVFEGMLYAVLYTLKRERVGGGSAPVVLGVEPQRVARFWGDGGVNGDGEGAKKVKRTSREGKRVKIDLVGGWLDSAVAVNDGVVPISDEVRTDLKVEVGGDQELRGLVDSYLVKWKRMEKEMEKSAKKVRPNDKIGENGFPRGIVANIGKLDDLADCLLQGVTWLDWQIMRNRVLREGAQAVGIE